MDMGEEDRLSSEGRAVKGPGEEGRERMILGSGEEGLDRGMRGESMEEGGTGEEERDGGEATESINESGRGLALLLSEALPLALDVTLPSSSPPFPPLGCLDRDEGAPTSDPRRRLPLSLDPAPLSLSNMVAALPSMAEGSSASGLSDDCEVS